MAIEADAKGKHPEEGRFIKDGMLKRPIFQVAEELQGVFKAVEGGQPTPGQRQQIANLILELEVYGHGFLNNTAPQHEADAANTLNMMERAVSDPLVELLGITSREALEASEV